MIKKILYVVNVDWYFQMHWLARAKSCRDAGIEVHVATNFTDLRIKKELSELGITCHQLNLSRSTSSPANELRSLIDLHRIIKAIKPCISHSTTIKANIYSGLSCRILKQPNVKTQAGTGWVYSKKNLLSKAIQPIISLVYRVSNNKQNCLMTFENADDYSQFVNKKIIRKDQGIVIRGAGVDPDIYDFTEIEPNSKIILFAARLLRSKGLETLIKANKIVREAGYESSLWVAGIFDSEQPDSISQSEIESWDKKGDITWLGHRSDVHDLIKKSICVALPTTYGEGTPRILIESASSGRPIITTNVPGCREITIDGHNGFLIEPENHHELAERIITLITDHNMCISMGYNGRQKVLNEYTEKSVLEQTTKTYLKLLKNN